MFRGDVFEAEGSALGSAILYSFHFLTTLYNFQIIGKVCWCFNDTISIDNEEKCEAEPVLCQDVSFDTVNLFLCDFTHVFERCQMVLKGKVTLFCLNK